MNRFLICLLSGTLFLQTFRGTDEDFKTRQSKIADALAKNPASKVKLVLYSLNPKRVSERKFSENSDKVFHQYPILGRAEITSATEKTDLLDAFAKGIRESDGDVVFCFNPRHGIRIIDGTTTNDFVICFECRQVESYGFSVDSFSTDGSAGKTFNKFLDEYHIKKAQE